MKNKCFAMQPNGKCNALTVLKCIGKGCAFYKTEKQYYRDRKRAEEINIIKGVRYANK